MDPSEWPLLAWPVVALGLASICASILLFLWRAIFRRKPGWMLDSLTLGGSGFVLVLAMMAYLLLVAPRIPKELQRLGGYLVMAGVGLPLVWVSVRIQRWKAELRSRRTLGSAQGEFTVPDSFNDPLSKDIEDEFYK